MKVLFIGFGAVARCVCHTWKLVLNDIPITKAIIIEPKKKLPIIDFPDWLNYSQLDIKLTEENYKYVLDKLFDKFNFDLVIDLSVYVDGLAMIDWCQERKTLYINTAIECWENTETWRNSNDVCPTLKKCEENKENYKTLEEYTLQSRQNEILKKHPNSTVTALIDMGQNPGCVSIYLKCALDFLCDKYEINGETYAEKAMKLGLETIHISEIDTQITNLVANDKIFYNTWSPVGYVEEANDPVQLGFGSHEDILPTGVIMGDQIILPIRGMNAYAHSYEPMQGELIGRLISHSENNTLTTYLKHANYKPSTYYVYKSSKISQDSLEIMKNNNYDIQPNFQVLTTEDIISGYDSVGVLLLFKDKPSFWYGSIATNNYAKKINPYINATTLQVAAGILGGIGWMLRNKNKGICFSENIDTNQDFINKVKVLLEHVYCGFVDFKPKSNKMIDLIVQDNKLI